MNNIYQVLENLKIEFKKYEHPAVYTVNEAAGCEVDEKAAKTKNLFLRNKKGDRFYLVVVEANKRLDLKKLAESLEEGKFSFATPERLKEYLGLTPGSVSPFGLINDQEKTVRVVVDKELLEKETVGFHPNINTATLVIKTSDFKKFLEAMGNKILYQDLLDTRENPPDN